MKMATMYLGKIEKHMTSMVQGNIVIRHHLEKAGPPESVTLMIPDPPKSEGKFCLQFIGEMEEQEIRAGMNKVCFTPTPTPPLSG